MFHLTVMADGKETENMRIAERSVLCWLLSVMQVNSSDSKLCIAGCEICPIFGFHAKCPKNCFSDHQQQSRYGRRNHCWVNARLHCEQLLVSTPYKGLLRPNMGVLRMARSAVMETREDSNQHVFRFCGFFSSLVSVMGLSCWGVCSYTSEPKMCHRIWTKCLWVCLERNLEWCCQGKERTLQSTCFRLLRVSLAC